MNERGLRVAIACLVASSWGCTFWRAPQIGAGFAAKITCSLAHNSGQDPSWVIDEYVRYESPPLASLVSVSIDDTGSRSRVLGLWRARAVRRPGLGCTLLAGKELVTPEGVTAARRTLDPASPWPQGAADPPPASPALEAALDRAFAEPDRARGRVRHTTAVVIAHDGRLVAERYARGYAATTPMLSWSMAKSVIATLLAIEIGDGRLSLHARAPVPEWSSPDDPRRAITLDQLLRMTSGLAWDESYGSTNDVARMLFTEPDAGAYAAAKPLDFPPDTTWKYSSGTSNIVARIFRDLHGGDLAAQVRFARERLFDPADITSAIFEADAAGGLIGSSFVFMTARDWARFVELHRRDGVWNGRRLLPEGWVRYVTTPTPQAPRGEYGAHWWLNTGAPHDPAQRLWPKLPPDTYAATGHNGQYALAVPSAKLVVVRLGLSLPDGEEVGLEDLVLDAMHALAREAQGRDLPETVARQLPVVASLARLIEDPEAMLGEPVRARVLAALDYVTDPDDVIPDTTPSIGLLDDAVAVDLVARGLAPELEACAARLRARECEDTLASREALLAHRATYARMERRREQRARRGGLFVLR